MGASVEEYEQLVGGLLPDGPIWERETGSGIGDASLALADELVRIHDFLTDLLAEMLPATADALISEWEGIFGLPDPTAPAPTTLSERQAALKAAAIANGGQTPAYFIALAAALGVTITINEDVFDGSECGVMEAGDEVVTDNQSAFIWEVIAPAATGADTRSRLEARINRHRPAHTLALFSYTA